MSKIYILEPEVPGGFGPRTKMDRSVHPPQVERLHFVFDGWLGDQLVESFPCFLATIGLAQSFVSAGVTGFELADAEVEASEQFKEMYPERDLPRFNWLRVSGNSPDSDIFVTVDDRLAVNERVLEIILHTNPQGLEYREAS